MSEKIGFSPCHLFKIISRSYPGSGRVTPHSYGKQKWLLNLQTLLSLFRHRTRCFFDPYIAVCGMAGFDFRGKFGAVKYLIAHTACCGV